MGTMRRPIDPRIADKIAETFMEKPAAVLLHPVVMLVAWLPTLMLFERTLGDRGSWAMRLVFIPFMAWVASSMALTATLIVAQIGISEVIRRFPGQESVTPVGPLLDTSRSHSRLRSALHAMRY
jgi:hypothetical protein